MTKPVPSSGTVANDSVEKHAERTGSRALATSQMLSLPLDLVLLHKLIYVDSRSDRESLINRSDHNRTLVNF